MSVCLYVCNEKSGTDKQMWVMVIPHSREGRRKKEGKGVVVGLRGRIFGCVGKGGGGNCMSMAFFSFRSILFFRIFSRGSLAGWLVGS